MQICALFLFFSLSVDHHVFFTITVQVFLPFTVTAAWLTNVYFFFFVFAFSFMNIICMALNNYQIDVKISVFLFFNLFF